MHCLVLKYTALFELFLHLELHHFGCSSASTSTIQRKWRTMCYSLYVAFDSLPYQPHIIHCFHFKKFVGRYDDRFLPSG